MSLFKRDRARAPATLPPPTSPGCLHHECSEPSVADCSYEDHDGGRCRTSWCVHHLQLFDNAPFCRRHVGIMRALAWSGQSQHRPPVADRAASLANWVGDDIDERIRNYLEGIALPERREVLVVEPLSHALDPSTGHHHWHRTWKLAAKNGESLEVKLDVEESNDATVRLTVAGETVVEVVPPWIENRLKGTRVTSAQDAAERTGFRDEFLDRLATAVDSYRGDDGTPENEAPGA